jgi:hypothetical protein
MQTYVWAKSGSEAGQTISQILARKEAERRAGRGVFWGHGTSLGCDVHRALDEAGGEISVYFTELLGRAQPHDESPEGVRLWTHYADGAGVHRELPTWAIVTSKDGPSSTHYALVCRSHVPLSNTVHGVFDKDSCVTFKNGLTPGPSQIVALVRGSVPPHVGGRYGILFGAALTDAVTLVDSRILGPAERRLLASWSDGNWKDLCVQLRG